MPKKGVNISSKGYDDIFSTEQSRTEEQQERVQKFLFLSCTLLKGTRSK